MDLKTDLPSLLPYAIEWAEVEARQGGLSGRTLNNWEVALAKKVGVQRSELIRVVAVDSLPMPIDQRLRAAAIHTGLLGPHMDGLTLDHTVFICRGEETTRLLSHEFRHVYQYELAGSIAAFLHDYLQQIVEVGYHNAEFEIDARTHEQDSP